jgi:hypothetical protein
VGADGFKVVEDENGNSYLYLTNDGEIISDGVLLPYDAVGGGTIIYVEGVEQESVNFDSDPQGQLTALTARVAALEDATVDIDSIDASKVIFTKDIYTAYDIGKIKGATERTLMAEKGSTLQSWFDIFDEEFNPTITDPSVSITFSKAGSYEVGTVVSPISYSATFDSGSYSYGSVDNPASTSTGVTLDATDPWSVSDTKNNKSTSSSGTFADVEVVDDISYKITATAKYGEGLVPTTNQGNSYSAGQIKEGEKSATSSAITGYRNSFYGTKTTEDALTSSSIRDLTKSRKALANGSAISVSVPVGALRVVIAYPATLRDLTSVKDVNGMNAEIVTGFAKSTIKVAGANEYNPIDYKVYIMDFANAIETANTFKVTI